VFSSIDPATIEMNQGMLTKVGLKGKGTITDVVKLAATIARAADRPPAEIKCTPDARDALATKVSLDTEITRLKDAIKAVEQAAPASLTEEQGRLLERLDAQLAAAKARKAKHVEDSLTKKVLVQYRPDGGAALKPPLPLEAFSSWFGTTVTQEWLQANGAINFAVGKPVTTGPDAKPPSRGFGYKGIYYRRPAVADVTASYTAGKVTTEHILRGERIPQLGTLARVAVEGTVIGSRGIALEFDADGDLKKYEMSSGSILADAESAGSGLITAAEGDPDKTELQKLTEKVDVVKKKRELIEEQAKLDAVTVAPQ
jgi:hypothetical protein